MPGPHAIGKLERRLLSRVGRAIQDYALIVDGDRILVALSGGKDSFCLLSLLDRLRRRAPIGFDVVPWHLDQGQPGYDGSRLASYLEARGGEYVIARQDTYSVVREKVPAGATFCALCSRLRRGVLYNAAMELGCTRIALGHHGDDAVETLLLNLLFTGQIKAMPPWLRSDDGRNVVIRPLITCRERDLAAYAREKAFPILPCGLCNNQPDLERQAVKRLLDTIEQRHPRIRDSMLAALTRVRATHLHDAGLWRSLGLGPPELPESAPLRGWERLGLAD